MSERAAVEHGLRALRHLSERLQRGAEAQFVHRYEKSGEDMVRHVANPAECPVCSWLAIIESALFAALASLPSATEESS